MREFLFVTVSFMFFRGLYVHFEETSNWHVAIFALT